MQGDLTGLVLDDRYVLQQRLGAGGMGEVWRCRDQRIGRDVAVKLLLDLRLNAEIQARFEREARVAGGLSSPWIVTLHDYGHGQLAGRDVPYLVMELLQGRTLAQIRNDERNSRRVLTWGAQVCAALDVAHRAGVVHRDIKPSNVMVTDDGGLKVLDFGIARVIEDGQTRAGLTADGTVMGTADYMSPEQAAGQPADTRSDLYSFGCLLYFLVTARPPFVADTFFAMLQLQMNATPEPPSKYRPGLPPELDGLIMALLAKDPAARPPGARAVREALEAMLPAAASQGSAPDVAAQTPDTGSGTTPTPTPTPTSTVPIQPGSGSAAAPVPSATPTAPTVPAPTPAGSTPAAVPAQPVTPASPSTPQPLPPHVPMQPPTHPPTQVGEWASTRVVPAEFGGRGDSGAAETEQAQKSGSGLSRRKLLIGVGGLAGVAAAGGGAYAALGKDTKKTGGTTTGGTAQVAAGSSTAPTATGTATSASSSAAASETSSASASSAEASTPSESSSATGAQSPLSPENSPAGKIDIPGHPNMWIMYINGGKALVVSDDQNGVQIFDVTNPGSAPKIGSIAVPLSDGQLKPMLAMDYSAKRALLALGGAGGLALWDVKDPAKPVSLSALADINGKKVRTLGFNSDGTKIVVAADDSETYFENVHDSCVMDVSDPHHPVTWSSLTPATRDAIAQALYSPDDKFIASVGYGDDSSSAIFQLWNSSDPHNVRPVDSAAWWGHGDSAMKLNSTLYVASGGPWHTLVVGVVSADSKSQDLQFLDFSKPQTPAKQWYFQSTSGAVAFHPARPVVAIGDARSGATTLYDMTDPHRPTQVARLVADAGAVASLAFTPDGTQLAVALKREGYGSDSDAMVYFWKVA